MPETPSINGFIQYLQTRETGEKTLAYASYHRLACFVRLYMPKESGWRTWATPLFLEDFAHRGNLVAGTTATYMTYISYVVRYLVHIEMITNDEGHAALTRIKELRREASDNIMTGWIASSAPQDVKHREQHKIAKRFVKRLVRNEYTLKSTKRRDVYNFQMYVALCVMCEAPGFASDLWKMKTNPEGFFRFEVCGKNKNRFRVCVSNNAKSDALSKRTSQLVANLVTLRKDYDQVFLTFQQRVFTPMSWSHAISSSSKIHTKILFRLSDFKFEARVFGGMPMLDRYRLMLADKSWTPKLVSHLFRLASVHERNWEVISTMDPFKDYDPGELKEAFIRFQ